MPAVGSNPLYTHAYIASEVMTAKHFVKVNATEDYIDICDTDGERVFGVIDEGADSDDVTNEKRLTVTILGVAVVIVGTGATIAFGDPVRTDELGCAISLATTTADQNVAGIAMADGVAADWLAVLLTPGASEST